MAMRRGDRRGAGGGQQPPTPTDGSEAPPYGAQERALPGGLTAAAVAAGVGASSASASCGSAYNHRVGSAASGHPPPSLEPVARGPAADGPAHDSPMDLDVTVLAFAQWVSEMKARHLHAQNQLRAEMSMIRSATSSNQTDLTDFKRHGAAIQQQMQNEINEIRESLSGVFSEITAAVWNNAAADQDIKLKVQALNEQAVRNETAFAQLADAADQSQSKLRAAVTEMQLSSDRMRDELGSLVRHSEGLESSVGERVDRMGGDIDELTKDLQLQLERRREHLRKMVNDVVTIGESLQSLVADFGEQKRHADAAQSKIHSTISAADQSLRKESVPSPMGAAAASACGGCSFQGRLGGLPPTVDALPPAVPPASMGGGYLPPGYGMGAHPGARFPMGLQAGASAAGSPAHPRMPCTAGAPAFAMGLPAQQAPYHMGGQAWPAYPGSTSSVMYR